MKLELNQVFKTPKGLYLRVKKVNESGTHIFQLIEKDGTEVPERRNKFGHVTERNIRVCSEETISTFKKVKVWNQ